MVDEMTREKVKEMDIKVRLERPEDYRQVEEVAREAFWNLYFPGCEEHYVIHKMRDHEDFIPELGFVIEVDGQVAGAIFYTKAAVVADNGEELETISFGPVCIHPKFHRMGLGRRMITHSMEIAGAMGHEVILTLGYPYHYEPYGFRGGKKYGISMPDGKFYTGLLVMPLVEGALDGVSGYARFSDVFEVESTEVEAYDQSFPPKEKKFQESQDEFEKASAELDES